MSAQRQTTSTLSTSMMKTFNPMMREATTKTSPMLKESCQSSTLTLMTSWRASAALNSIEEPQMLGIDALRVSQIPGMLWRTPVTRYCLQCMAVHRRSSLWACKNDHWRAIGRPALCTVVTLTRQSMSHSWYSESWVVHRPSLLKMSTRAIVSSRWGRSTTEKTRNYLIWTESVKAQLTSTLKKTMSLKQEMKTWGESF